MSLLVFWVVMPCGIVGIYQSFGGTFVFTCKFSRRYIFTAVISTIISSSSNSSLLGLIIFG
jgi:hypothetical protein